MLHVQSCCSSTVTSLVLFNGICLLSLYVAMFYMLLSCCSCRCLGIVQQQLWHSSYSIFLKQHLLWVLFFVLYETVTRLITLYDRLHAMSFCHDLARRLITLVMPCYVAVILRFGSSHVILTCVLLWSLALVHNILLCHAMVFWILILRFGS